MTDCFLELDYLLDLAARRTPGRIQAKAASLQVGRYTIEGFPKETDAHYLAQAANMLPKLVSQLLATRTIVDNQAREIAALREELSRAQGQGVADDNMADQAEAIALLQDEIFGLRDELAVAYQNHDKALKTLQEARRSTQQLKRQPRNKPQVIVEQRVVEVAKTWIAPDGHCYELVCLPNQLEDSAEDGKVA
jgi:hypothetical protein